MSASSLFSVKFLLRLLYVIEETSTFVVAALTYAVFELSDSSNLYPGDLIPFTRKPLFLIIDSDNSHAFKAGLSKLVYEFLETVRWSCCVYFSNLILLVNVMMKFVISLLLYNLKVYHNISR